MKTQKKESPSARIKSIVWLTLAAIAILIALGIAYGASKPFWVWTSL